MIYPDFPKKGDTIGICAPSAGTGYKIDSYKRSLEVLRSEGYAIKETANVRSEYSPSADAKTRGEEFNLLAGDSAVKAIISAAGGDYNIDMLPFLDARAVAEGPKWITGASDPTNILYYVTTKLDIATVYGFNAGTFDLEPLHPFCRNALDVLKGDLKEQKSFDFYDASTDFMTDTVSFDHEVVWESFTPSGSGFEEAPVDIEGRLIGGCTDVIANLIGTPYDGTADFIKKYDDIIWYFDTFAMSAEDLYRTMVQMKYCGYFRNTKAAVIGRILLKRGSEDGEFKEALKKTFDFPFIYGADIGHVKPTMTFINGSVARIRCADGKGSIRMKLE